MRAKNFGEKIVVKKGVNRFIIFTRITLTKNGGGKKRETIFPETQGQCVQKMLGKKSSGKSAKNVFLYSHEYRELKMGEKTREFFFPETHE